MAGPAGATNATPALTTFGEDSQEYGYAASQTCLNPAKTSGQAAARPAAAHRRRAERDGRIPEDEHFYAEQNARLVTKAERILPANTVRGRVPPGDLRDELHGRKPLGMN